VADARLHAEHERLVHHGLQRVGTLLRQLEFVLSGAYKLSETRKVREGEPFART
jgi:hypothetical protein